MIGNRRAARDLIHVPSPKPIGLDEESTGVVDGEHERPSPAFFEVLINSGTCTLPVTVVIEDADPARR